MKLYTIRFILSLTAILAGSAFLMNAHLSNSVSEAPLASNEGEFTLPVSSPILLPSERAAFSGSPNPDSVNSNVNLAIEAELPTLPAGTADVPGGDDDSVAAIPSNPSTDEPVLPGINAESTAPQPVPVPYYAPISANAQEKPEPEQKLESKPEQKPESKPEQKPEPKPEALPVPSETSDPTSPVPGQIPTASAPSIPIYAVTETPEEKFSRMLAYAQSLSRKQNLSQAEKAYRELVEQYPRRWEAWHGLARLYEEAGETNMADYFYKEAVKLHVKNAVVYNDYGWFLLTCNRLGDAYDQLSCAVQYDPKNPCYLNNLGACMCLQNRPDSAVELFVQANGGDRYEAFFNVASIAWNRGDANTTAVYLDKVLIDRPTHSGARKLFEELKKYAAQLKAQQEQAEKARRAQEAAAVNAANGPTPSYKPQSAPSQIRPKPVTPAKITPAKIGPNR